MTNEQFDFELGRYGGDLARWPVELRAAAEALIATSTEAAARQREAQALDRLLVTGGSSTDADRSVEGLIARIVPLPQEAAPTRAALSAWSVRGPRLRYAACLLAALTGFTIGALDSGGSRLPPDLLDLAFGSPAGGFDVQ
jgi:hypothetical protein